MPPHTLLLTVEGADERVRITIQCDTCGDETFSVPVTHLGPLARALPRICQAAGVDVTTSAEPIIFERSNDEPAH